MKIFKMSVFILAIVTAFQFASVAEAASQGKVVFLKGSGKRIRSGAKQSLKVGMQVRQGDTVVTRSNTTLVIRLVTGSKVKIKANTKISFTKLTKTKLTKLYLHKGGVFAKIKKLRGKQKFRVQSVSTVAGVRGTQFYMHTLKTEDIWLCVNEGEVRVKESGSKSSVLVQKGLGITVKKNATIEKPIAYKWTKKLNWKMDKEEGELEDKVDLDKVYDILDIEYD